MGEQRVRLRPHTEADLPNYVEWLNDPEVTQFTVLEAGSVTLEGEREWFRAISAPDCTARNWAIEMDGRHVGVCSLIPDDSRQTAGFGIIIGDKTQWGKGCGTAALREVMRIGFQEMGLHRIQLTVSAENARGLRCYEKCGFRHEGLARKSRLKRGEWRDIVSMAILREEWESCRAGIPMPAEGDPAGRPYGGITHRTYRPSDYKQVSAIWRAEWGEGRPMDTADALDHKLTNDPGPFLVAEMEGRVVGTVLGSWDGRWAWVTRLAVHPDYRRRGLAKLLMVEVEQRLAALGATFAALLTGRENAGAMALYESLGYEHREHVAYLRTPLSAGEDDCCGQKCS